MKATVALSNLGRLAVAYWFIEAIVAVWFFLATRFMLRSWAFVVFYVIVVCALYVLSIWMVAAYPTRRVALTRITVFACLFIFAYMRLCFIYMYFDILLSPGRQFLASLSG